MKRPENKTWLLMLMIISQMMLTGLVFQWLRSQWFDEKESFTKDVSLEFRESVNQVLDSMLIKHLLVPVFKDSLAGNEQIIRFDERIPAGNIREKQHITAFFNGNRKQKEAVITLSVDDTVNHPEAVKPGFQSIDSAEKKLLLRSVKLIIRQSADSAGKGSHFNHMISAAPDTILLKKLFDNKLPRLGKKLIIRWRSDSVEEEAAKSNSKLYFESFLLEKPYGAEINHFGDILLKGISAQIVFATILLLFTGAAFFFTYRSLKKMETLNTLRNDFISNISHELKTPVSTVSIALEALKNYGIKNDPAMTAEYLDIAWKEMKRLDQLITQVLNTSLPEDKNQYIQPEEVDLVSLTKEVLDSMQVRFSQQNARIDFRSEPEVCLLDLDKLHIQGVIINLLDNSLKYSTGDPEIGIGIEQKRSSVLLKISDNGKGIPEEYLQKVFDKFFRVPGGDTHNVKGYGLGLSFAYLVMKHHSGSISVRNLKKGGCEFTLTFPGTKK